ncbi:hypothetical protein E2C01_098340 [Portunus trituberculatus]|uniref:Uncharacterized protein n=1 Tax=Portunus trituberculatus TaxID=210409 RepID=A0A5B7KCN4_PORTR|nr:hypothetical protein [Portunus trituberculatus]
MFNHHALILAPGRPHVRCVTKSDVFTAICYIFTSFPPCNHSSGHCFSDR